MKSLTHILTATAVVLVLQAARTQAAFYTNADSFIFAINTGHYTEGFDGLMKGEVIPPAHFTNTGFSFDATTTSGSSLYCVGPGADHWLTVSDSTKPLVFTNFTNATAFGGYFFNTDDSGIFSTNNLTLLTVGDGTIYTNFVTNVSTTNFFGWTFASSLSSVSIISTNLGSFPTAGSVTLGTTVPEPSTWALLLLGAGTVVLAARLGRKG